MFRIDPINKISGQVDLAFFSSDEYKLESVALVEYLMAEGFDEVEEKFFIDFRNRKWEVTPPYEKKKKKKK
jgi:hypothetical protein